MRFPSEPPEQFGCVNQKLTFVGAQEDHRTQAPCAKGTTLCCEGRCNSCGEDSGVAQGDGSCSGIGASVDLISSGRLLTGCRTLPASQLQIRQLYWGFPRMSYCTSIKRLTFLRLIVRVGQCAL
jgi:hypothetical protein